MMRAAWMAAAAVMALPAMAKAEPWSRAYVVDWLEPAFLHDGPENDNIVPGKDCPAGAATTPGWKVQFQTPWRDPAEIKFYLDAENRPLGIRVARWRGPNLEDVWAHPTAGPDLHVLPAVSWNMGLGFDLDGKAGPADFTSPDGVKGIDNNYYRAAGCWVSYRGAPYHSQRGIGINGYMKDGLYTIVMVVSGNKDPMNDDDATLAFYQSRDKIIKDNQGQVAYDATYAILPTTRTQSLVKVKVAGGVIETASPQELRLRDEAWNSAIPDQLQLTSGRLRLKMKENGGLEGYLGGYQSWKALYKKQAVPARDTESNQGLDMPTFYYQLERYADADPDPATGKNRRISAAYRLRAAPAFVLTPDYAKTVTVAQAFAPPSVAPAMAATGGVTRVSNDAVGPGDPPDMVAAARTRAQAAPVALSRRSLALVALPTISTATFRDVRALYIREELVNDQIVFCGEVDAQIPGAGKRSGWTKFAYIPGDPTTFATETEGLGIHELGKRIVGKYCGAANAKWLSADFTADFQQKPRNLAEASAAGGGSE